MYKRHPVQGVFLISIDAKGAIVKEAPEGRQAGLRIATLRQASFEGLNIEPVVDVEAILGHELVVRHLRHHVSRYGARNEEHRRDDQYGRGDAGPEGRRVVDNDGRRRGSYGKERQQQEEQHRHGRVDGLLVDLPAQPREGLVVLRLLGRVLGGRGYISSKARVRALSPKGYSSKSNYIIPYI